MKNKRKQITIITLLLIAILVIGFITVNKFEKQESIVVGKLPTTNASTTDTYTIIFDANGGTGAPSTMTINGTSGTLPSAEPTRSGYEFLGWSVKSDPYKVWCIAGGNFSFNSLGNGDLVDNTLTLTALWEKIYTIEFDANGGTGAPNTMTIRGASGTLPVTEPTRAGYDFLGWSVKSDPNKVWCIAGGNFSFNSLENGDLVGDTLKLTALWEEVYTIYFDANGGTGAPSTMTLRGTSGKLPDAEPTRAGYDFLGWTVKSDPNKVWCIAGGNFNMSTVDAGDLVGNTLTLKALWEEVYTIYFDANGGTGAPSTMTLRGTSGKLPEAEPTKSGYEFLGWTVKSDPNKVWCIAGGNFSISNVGEGDLVGNTLTLTALWDKICTIKFDANGGIASKDTMEIREGLNYTNLPSATRTGYIFQGWYDSQTGGTKITEETIVKATDDNKTLYAHWTPNTYTITFNSNGGNGTMADIDVEYSDTVKLSSNKFTRTDYKFTGWNTKADGTGTSYKDEDSLEFIGENCENITLYAQWKQVNSTYKIEHYKEENGSYVLVDTETERGIIGEQVTATVNTYDGYIFNTEKSNSTLSGTLGDTTLTLKVYYKKLEGNFIKIIVKDSSSGEIQSATKVTLYDNNGKILDEMVSNMIGEVAFENLEKGQEYAYKIEGEQETNKFIVTESGNIENITDGDKDEPGDSDNSGNTGDKDEPGDSDNSGNTGDKDEPGDSDNSGNTGDKDEPGDSDNSGNTGDKDEPGDSNNSGNIGNTNGSGNSNNSSNTNKIPTEIDNTQSQDTLPKTGISRYMIFAIIISAIAIIAYIKYKKLNNILKKY